MDRVRRDYSQTDTGQENLPWGSDKPVYEWQQEYTEASAPADQKLETELFDEDHRVQAEDGFHKRNQTDQVRLKGGPKTHTPITDVSKGGRSPVVMSIY